MMVTKIVNTDIDMYGNRVTNLCVEVLPELPETTSEGRLVYLKAARQIFVYSDGSWQTVGELNPKGLSAFENDVGYLTASTVGLDNYYTKEETDTKIGELVRLQFKVVDTLPETGEPNFIYLVPSTSSKAKNVKDEWIWVDGDWELIGSTAFKLNLIQDADGIAINDDVLQKATEEQDGLMTKEMVKEFRGKQDKLTAGPNISIEGGVISAIGGGSGGGHMTSTQTISSSDKSEGGYYVVSHKLSSYNILFQIRTTVPPIEHVQARVVSPDENTFWVYLSEDLAEGETLKISMLACDVSTPSSPSDEVDFKIIEQESAVWTYINETGKPMYVQLFDSNGNEIRGDVTQESTEMFSPVVASLTAPSTGTMLVKPADIFVPFTQETNVVIDVTDYDYTTEDMFLVQVYIDGTGQSMPDIIQDTGTGIVSVDLGDEAKTGTIVLVKATRMPRIEGEMEKTYTHDLGRIVGVQLYLDGTGQAMTDVVCTDENTVVISANPAITGHALIL